MGGFTELLLDMQASAVIGAINRYKIQNTDTQIHGLCPTNLHSANERQSKSWIRISAMDCCTEKNI